ncbi:MAG: hypothetical protein J7K37_02350 [Candidatus Omnitrophica bacterium]|nr:hypothetical protein [Candidatus Omnitrophota bacterium]
MRIFFVILSLLFLGGCLSLNFSQLQLRELESQSFKYEDIPLPKGFRFLIKDSIVTETGKTRAGTLVFKGKALPSEITNFYKTNMPHYGWRLLNTIEGKQSLMNFKKKDEICTIRFEWKGTGGILTVSFSPYFESDLPEEK